MYSNSEDFFLSFLLYLSTFGVYFLFSLISYFLSTLTVIQYNLKQMATFTTVNIPIPMGFFPSAVQSANLCKSASTLKSKSQLKGLTMNFYLTRENFKWMNASNKVAKLAVINN